jgi:YD repeat-containing protein
MLVCAFILIISLDVGAYPAITGYSAANGQAGFSPTKAKACTALDVYFYGGTLGLYPNPSTPIYTTPGTHCGYTCDVAAYGNYCGVSIGYSGLYCPYGGSLIGTECKDANSPAPPSNCGKQCPEIKNPINPATGNKYQIENDYIGSGGSVLSLTRTYNRKFSSRMSLGKGWRHSYERAIAAAANGMIAVIHSDGKVFFFSNNNGIYLAADTNDKLQATGTGWIYTRDNNVTEFYDSEGKLISITYLGGVTHTLSYDVFNRNLLAVTDSFGHRLTFTYGTNGLLQKVTDPSSGIYLYTYDSVNNLISVTYPDTSVRNYHYENVTYPNALTGITDEKGIRYSTYTYDAKGRAISTEHANGVDRASLVYNADSTGNITSTVVTDPLGSQRTYNFTTIQGVVKSTGQSQPGGSGCAASASNLTYDANGNIATRTDFKGNITTYIYDLTRNLEVSRTEAFGTPQARTINTQWHPTYRLPVMVTEPLRSTNYTYDPQGNLLTLAIMPMGGTAGPRTTNYTYNQYGQVLSIDGPRTDVSDVTSYSYDPQGNLISVSNALNQTTTLGAYDPNGRVGTITNPNGLATTLGYDLRGRLTTRTVGTELTRYTYDGVGNLTNVTLPNGAAYTYTYDAAHRLTQIADAQNNRIVYTLDAAGNRTREETYDNNGTLIQTHSRLFDALNRLWQDIGAVNQTTTYTYDANGNITSISDPLNRISTHTYDALNRLSQVTNPDLGITRYGYDAQDQLTSVTDPRNLITQYQRDGLGNLNQTNSPDTGNTNATYDEAGNLRTKLDAKGQLTSYTYDALNRLIGIVYTGGTAPAINVSYLYDQGANGIGHLSGIADHTGVTQYSYDQNGRLIAEIRQSITGTGNAPAYTTAYNYDSAGRMINTTYPSGRTVNYSHDPMGRINTISTTDASSNTTVIASNINYRPFGGVQSYTYGDGQIAQPQLSNRQYDQDGRIASYSLNGQPQIIGYDAASQISFINTLGGPLNPPSIANYSYDPMSRLTSYTQGSANQSYNYDQVGNRVSQLIGSTTTNYGIDPMSNKLSSIQSGQGAPQPITQDAIGATTSDAAHQYAYDVRGRLIQATTAQGQINYEVNALGLRIRKQVPYANTDTQYHYDTQGHLIGENTTGTTQFSREYIWLGDIPVAVMQ